MPIPTKRPLLKLLSLNLGGNGRTYSGNELTVIANCSAYYWKRADENPSRALILMLCDENRDYKIFFNTDTDYRELFKIEGERPCDKDVYREIFCKVVGLLIGHPLMDITHRLDQSLLDKLFPHGEASKTLRDAVNKRSIFLHLLAVKDPDVLKAVLETFDIDLNIRDIYDQTPLHYAAKSGGAEVVEVLLAAGADVKVKDRSNYTALHFAAQYGNADAVRLLLKKDADVKVTTSDGSTALHLAAKSGNADALEVLLEAGAEINVKDRYDYTALHFAAESGNADAVRLLLENGADFKTTTSDGSTALHLAARHGNADVLEVLLAEGAEINFKDRYGYTALHLMVESGNAGAVSLLLEEGANVSATTFDGSAALHLAAKSGNADVLEVLLEKCADVNVKDRHGYTALHIAAECKNARLRNKYGYTHDAAMKRNADAVRLLLKKDANVDIENNEGKKAFDIARQQESDEIVLLLNAQTSRRVGRLFTNMCSRRASSSQGSGRGI